MATDDKMTIAEAAEALGVSRNTIFNMADRGLLRIIERPFGRPRHFVPREDVKTLLDAVDKSEEVIKKQTRKK